MLLFAAFCLLPTLGFVVSHLRTPSDGARLSEQLSLFTTQGANVVPFLPGESTLREGDVVTAVNGVLMEDWAEALFSGGPDRQQPAWKLGDTVEYQVLRDGRSLAVEVALGSLPWREVLRSHWGALLFAFVSQVVAGFVYLRRREDPAARALFIWAFSGSHTYAWSFFLQVGDIVGWTGFWLFRLGTPLLWLIYWPASTHVALVFPRPLSIVRGRPYLIPGIYFSSFLIFSASLAFSWVRSENLLAWMNTWGPVDNLIAAIYLAATMVAIIFQRRRPLTSLERRQIRWVVFGALLSGLGGLVLWIGLPLLLGRSLIDANLLGLLSLPFPLALALAIWRHQLFDIDVIIRRTLQYSVVTLLLAGIYFSAVVLLQLVFQWLTGESDSPLITVVSTLSIAALFNPLRIRVQAFIDRRFFRTSYDAGQILEHFAATARDEVDLQALTIALLGAVDESMQPERMSLWLKPAARVSGEAIPGE
jgi:hypothetical protein